MQPQNSFTKKTTQKNQNEFCGNFIAMSPDRTPISAQKRSVQSNMTPRTQFTELSKQLPVSPFLYSKEASQKIQNYKNIEPNIIKKQKLNFYQTPSPKNKKSAYQIFDPQPVLQLTARKLMQNLELNDEQTGNKNITCIKIQSPVINLNYQKESDLEDELNMNKCLENIAFENIINLNSSKLQPDIAQQQQSQCLNTPDYSNVIYEFKFTQNKNNSGQKQEENSIDNDEEIDYDDDNENFDDLYLYDPPSDQCSQQKQQAQQEEDQQQQQQKQDEKFLTQDKKLFIKESQTVKKNQQIINYKKDNFSLSKYNQQIRINKQKFEEFKTPKQGSKIQKIQNDQMLNKSNLQKQEQTAQLITLTKQKNILATSNQQLIEEKQRIGCNCKKSRCLKLYCDCFAKGLFCTSECNCQDCANKEDNQNERNNIMLQLMEKNPLVFKPKVDKVETNQQEESHVRGCNCAKSGCVKKYCECFQAGVKCTPLCKCQNCQNKDD